MSELLIEFVSYVKEILGIEALPERWEGETTLPLFLREQYDFFQVRGMAGMRDVLSYEYFGINHKVVWNVVQKKLPFLIDDLHKMVRDIEGGTNGNS